MFSCANNVTVKNYVIVASGTKLLIKKSQRTSCLATAELLFFEKKDSEFKK